MSGLPAIAPEPTSRDTDSLSTEIVERVADLVDQTGLNEATLAGLREAWPKLRFTWCSEDDILAGKPVATRSAYDVYLISGEGQCLALTNDYERAIGIVFAEFEEP